MRVSGPVYPYGRQYIVFVTRIGKNPAPLPLSLGAVSGVRVGQADTCWGHDSPPRRYGAYTLYAVLCVRGVERIPRILSPCLGAVFRFFRRFLQTVLGGVSY